MPHALNGVELGRIRRKEKDLKLVAMLFVPLIYLRLFVIGRVILNEIYAVISPVKRWKKYLFKK